MVNKLVNFLWLLLLLLTAVAHAASNIQVFVDRNQVQENESFNVVFKANADVSDDPDFTPLQKDFQIIDRSQSSSIQIINGSMSREITWSLDLMPKHMGNLVIPSIAFGADRTQQKLIKVVKSTTRGKTGDEKLYMEASVDSNSVYVQSQVIYTLRIFHAVSLRNPSLSDLSISDKDAIIEKMDDKQYEKMVNGRRYQVYERSYAIFPQNTGELVIEPAVLDAQFIELPRSIRTRRVSSERIRVKVQDIPEQVKQKKLLYWLPAKWLKLEEKWSDKSMQIKVGDPITRTLTVHASGILPSAIPELASDTTLDGVKQYPDQPVIEKKNVGSDVMAKREEKIAYIPSKPGKMTLPAISLVWWNAQSNKMETAELPSRTITVLPAAGEAQPTQPDQLPATPSSDQNKTPEPTASGQQPAVSASGISSMWFWISLVLMFLWLTTLGLWMRAKHGAPTQKMQAEDESASTWDGLKQVKTACAQNDAQQAKNALLKWGHEQWPHNPPTSLGHIAQRVNGTLATELQQLNHVLYQSPDAGWNGAALWQSAKEYADQIKLQQDSNVQAKLIKPLFRLAPGQDDRK